MSDNPDGPVPSLPLSVFYGADASRTDVPRVDRYPCGCWERVEGQHVTAYEICDEHAADEPLSGWHPDFPLATPIHTEDE